MENAPLNQSLLEIIDKIKWDSSGLVPTIAQDVESKAVLMLAYSSLDSLKLSMQTHLAHYFSRSKGRIWLKGESSGHTQEIDSIKLDCDSDAILFLVRQNGVACHSGEYSCFFKHINLVESKLDKTMLDSTKRSAAAIYGIVDSLYHTILEKKFDNPQTSYTAKLYSKGANTICKKIAEEAAELCFAIKDGDKKEIIYECADLIYHMLVGLGLYEVSPDLVYQELLRREGISGIDEKNSRQDKC